MVVGVEFAASSAGVEGAPSPSEQPVAAAESRVSDRSSGSRAPDSDFESVEQRGAELSGSDASAEEEVEAGVISGTIDGIIADGAETGLLLRASA
jgi:hypothetical protein